MLAHARLLSLSPASHVASLAGKKYYVAFSVMAMLALAQSAQASIIETFDTGLDGWALIKKNGALSWQGSGGNPGGYALYTDTKAGIGTAKAPSAFLGNLSEYNDGQLSFDYKVFGTGAGIRSFAALNVTLYNKGKHYSYTIPTKPDSTWESLGWQTFTIPMTSATWHTTDAKWGNLLSNVTKMTISLESTVNVKRPYDTDGIDNITLTRLGEPPTPEPATLGVILIGALPLLIRRRRHSAAH
jgi:hypothetical protein